MMALPIGAPTSPLFEIRHTPHSGRAIFAAQDISADTLIWHSEDLVLEVLFREYRREVCGDCFGYERGHNLSVRDNAVGFVYCSVECQEKWKQRVGEIGVQAWAAAEQLVKGRSKDDSEMVDVGLPRPKVQEIKEAWEFAEGQAKLIRIAREGERDTKAINGVAEVAEGVRVTKQHRKALQKALMQPISPDIMSFCISGIIWKYNNPKAWDRVLALAADDTPYHNTDDLLAFTRTYLHLLSILPLPLVPLITSRTIQLLSTRDSHNAFGIRSLEDDGSEYFGYGCWPAASYFNHSCGPNVEKRREGRGWFFRSGRDIEKGEELCITYLSGEEREMAREQRIELLKGNWGFKCACKRCEEL